MKKNYTKNAFDNYYHKLSTSGEKAWAKRIWNNTHSLYMVKKEIAKILAKKGNNTDHKANTTKATQIRYSKTSQKRILPLAPGLTYNPKTKSYIHKVNGAIFSFKISKE